MIVSDYICKKSAVPHKSIIPGQTAHQKLRLDKAWLIFKSKTQSTVTGGWVQPLEECGLVPKQLKHPPLSRVGQELPIGS